MRLLDLFSGIGGFSLGLEAAGFQTVAFCEREPYCRAVLNKHWPGVPVYDDVTTLTADTLQRDGIAIDAICGGFPCQDLSYAGKRAGLEGARSGLWGEYRRIIHEVRPKLVFIENVPGLLSGGDTVELPPDQCVCGWTSRWGGLHHNLQSGEHALRAGGYGDVAEGYASIGGDAERVRRDDYKNEGQIREVGRGSRLENIRQAPGTVSVGCAAVSCSEEATGGVGSSIAEDDRWTAQEAEWLRFVDGASSEGCEDNQGACFGSEQEGASSGSGIRGCVCLSCGRDMGNSAGKSIYTSWFGRIQRDISTLGYDAWWEVVPASAVGAPHRRDRVWIVAHPNSPKREARGAVAIRGEQGAGREGGAARDGAYVAHPSSERRGEAGRDRPDKPAQRIAGSGQDVADADDQRLERRQRGSVPECACERSAGAGGASVGDTKGAERKGQRAVQSGKQSGLADASRRQSVAGLGRVAHGFSSALDGSPWLEEPANVPRVSKGVENRANRLKALGNAVVPQLVELVGRAALASLSPTQEAV